MKIVGTLFVLFFICLFPSVHNVFIVLNTNEVSAYANVAGTEKEHELSVMLDRIKSTGFIRQQNLLL